MYKQLAELTVQKSADYCDKVIKVLEDAGFVIVLKGETFTDKYCIVAESEVRGMTREEKEALEMLKYNSNVIHQTIHGETDPKEVEALDMAIKYSIKYLDQEPLLDKIKAEIRGMHRVILKGTSEDDWAVKWNQCLDEVLQIIDKYKED